MARLSVRPRAGGAASSSVPVEILESRRLLHAAPHDPAMMQEHADVLNLVPDAAVTHAAVRSGAWSQPATWRDARVPAAGADVLVPAGVTVTVDGVNASPLRTVRVDGVLSFATAFDTQLTVDTLVVTPQGALAIGTAAAPVAPDVTARVVFADRGAIDTAWDPRLFSRGLLSHGTTSLFGSAKTAFAEVFAPARKGATTLGMAEAPVGWRPGDRVVLAGTIGSGNQDEVRTVVAVAGRRVTLDRPLAWTHAAPQPDLAFYVANLTRNVVFASENRGAAPADVARRGHAMFMHSPHVDINNAAFDHVGRTDKSARINDPVLDAQQRLMPGTGTNPRGRYALHLHRTGLEPAAHAPAAVRGSVVTGGAGWGFVNHSSNVLFERNVSHDVFGSGFVTEAGDEVGAFRDNLALRSAGSGETPENRADVQDFGHEGNGFWFQGGGVEASDNAAAGHRRAAFFYYSRGLRQGGVAAAETRFPSSNLADPSIAGGAATLAVGDVPIRLFRGNYAFASGTGFESWYTLTESTHSARSVVDGFTAWGNRSGQAVSTPYTRHLTVRNLRALGSPRAPAGRAVSGNDITAGVELENPRIEGFEVGVATSPRGDTVVRGGILNNIQNVQVNQATGGARSVDVSGVRFGYLAPEALKGRRQYDVFFKPMVLNPAYRDLSDVFAADSVRVNSRQVYRAEQAADYVPYPAGAASTPPYVPAELVGKSNRQTWDAYGLAVGGAVAPDGAANVGRPRTNGLVGDPVARLPALTLNSRKYTNKLQGYQLAYTLESGTEVRNPWPQTLRPGWNLVSRVLGGRPHTFLVFGDATPPVVSAASALVINPLALSRGFVANVRVVDDSIGEITIFRSYGDLRGLPVRARGDGSQFVALEFRTSDLAGNHTAAVLELSLDASAPL